MKTPSSLLVVVVAVVGVAGCSFELPEPPGGEDEPGGPGTTPRCDDPELRLCLDFEDPEPLADHSTSQLETTMKIGTVTFDDRMTEQAARLELAALEIATAAAAPLDLEQLTVELWIQPAQINPGERFSMFDHGDRYFLAYRDDRRVECGINRDKLVDSGGADMLGDGAWHHVACTYDRTELRVYVDGVPRGCDARSDDIAPADRPTLIGASGGRAPDHFRGLLDDLRVLPRAMTPEQVCQAAGRSGCPTSCGGGIDQDD